MMALSKRLRYEIFRRDNHTCRYCGSTPPDVKLTVDHVVPTALGGSDETSNLVTACADCNAGKSSTNPDAPVVADVEQDAMRWAKAIERAADLHREQDVKLAHFRDFVKENWEYTFSGFYSPYYEPDRGWHYDDPDRKYDWAVYNHSVDSERPCMLADSEEECDEWMNKQRAKIPRMPGDWDTSLHLWLAAGIDENDVDAAMEKAKAASHVDRVSKYRYFCGIIWRTIEERQEIAKELMSADAEDDA